MLAELWQIEYYSWAPSQPYSPSYITSHQWHTVTAGDASLRLCKKAETPENPAIWKAGLRQLGSKSASK